MKILLFENNESKALKLSKEFAQGLLSDFWRRPKNSLIKVSFFFISFFGQAKKGRHKFPQDSTAIYSETLIDNLDIDLYIIEKACDDGNSQENSNTVTNIIKATL